MFNNIAKIIIGSSIINQKILPTLNFAFLNISILKAAIITSTITAKKINFFMYPPIYYFLKMSLIFCAKTANGKKELNIVI